MLYLFRFLWDSPVDIIVNWDASVANAPAAFKSAIENVVQLYDALFTNNITVTIGVGFGEVNGTALGANAAGESESELVGPVASSIGTIDVTAAEYLALGGSLNLAVDGYVGFNSSGIFNFANTNAASAGQYDITATAEHEISEVLGRVSTLGQTGVPSVLDDFRYSAPGVLATPTSATAYFSTNDGTTDLGNYNTVSGADAGDWAQTGTLASDAYAAFGTPGITAPLSSSDILLMNALGYDYNQNFANAAIVQNPILDNDVIGSGTNFAGLGGDDLFVVNPQQQLGFAEIGVSGTTETTVWFTWQSDGAASADGNALILAPSSIITQTATNLLGHGGKDIVVTTGYGTGASGTYEFTASGAVYAGGDIQFQGSGDTINGVAGASIDIVSGSADNVLISSGSVTIAAGMTGMNVIGTNDTIELAANTYVGLIGGAGDVVNNASAGTMVNLTSGASVVTSGSGGYFGICGTGIGLVASAESIDTVNGASFNLIGSYNEISLGAGAYLGLIGGVGNVVNDQQPDSLINLTSGASVTIQGTGGWVGICGTGISVDGSGQFISTIDDASFDLAGQNDVIGLGANSAISLLGGNAGFNTIFSAGGTIQAQGGANLNVAGENGVITLAGTGGTLGLLGGSGWTVSASGDVIQTLSGTAFDLNTGGGTDTVTLATASQFNLIAFGGGLGFISGSQDSLLILAGDSTQTVFGFNQANGDQIDLTGLLAGLSVTVANLANFVSVSSDSNGTQLTVAGLNGTDTIMLAGVGSMSLSSLTGTNALVLPATT